MWVMKYFKITETEVIRNFVLENGFATLVSKGPEFPEATHIPIDWEISNDGGPILRGHLAKANPQWRQFDECPEVLVIFQSPVQHYISSSWYGHENAPTWNYMSVHIQGKIRLIEGPELWDSVGRLTDRYEKISHCPVSLDTLPASVQKQMQAITGFEISISQIQASFKMSQNRNEADYQNVIKELLELETPMSVLMADMLSKLKEIDGH
jgi:transcriptional regulator